jgi:hypothetical protein
MVMVLYGTAREPRGLTSVPGFRTEAECEAAREQAPKPPIFNEPSLISIYTWCTMGPLK